MKLPQKDFSKFVLKSFLMNVLMILSKQAPVTAISINEPSHIGKNLTFKNAAPPNSLLNYDEFFKERRLQTQHFKTCTVEAEDLLDLENRTKTSIKKFDYYKNSTNCTFSVTHQTDCCKELLGLTRCLIENFSANLLKYFENCTSVRRVRALEKEYGELHKEFITKMDQNNRSMEIKFQNETQVLSKQLQDLKHDLGNSANDLNEYIRSNFVHSLSAGKVDDAKHYYRDLANKNEMRTLTKLAFENHMDDNFDSTATLLRHVKPITEFSKYIVHENEYHAVDMILATNECMVENDFNKKSEMEYVRAAAQYVFEHCKDRRNRERLGPVITFSTKKMTDNILQYAHNIRMRERLGVVFDVIEKNHNVFERYQKEIIEKAYDCEIKGLYNVTMSISEMPTVKDQITSYSILLNLMKKHSHLDVPELIMLAYLVKNLKSRVTTTHSEIYLALEESFPPAVRDILKKNGNHCRLLNLARNVYPYVGDSFYTFGKDATMMFAKRGTSYRSNFNFIKVNNTVNEFEVQSSFRTHPIFCKTYENFVHKQDDTLFNIVAAHGSRSEYGKWFLTPVGNASYFSLRRDDVHVYTSDWTYDDLFSTIFIGARFAYLYEGRDVYEITCDGE